MSHAIGVDLGTTNSVTCVVRRGSVETVPIEGRGTLPSVVSVRPDGSVLVGHMAKARAMLEPACSIAAAKRYIGDGRTTWHVLGATWTPVDVAKHILMRAKQAATEALGASVNEAVITVPAYFNNNQKRDTKAAGEAAGLRVLQLLPEPTAAAISYGLGQGKDQTLLVYDLGGGTFDVSILQVFGNRFQVMAVDGDSHLGGDDFDELLMQHLLSLVRKRGGRKLDALRARIGREASSGGDLASDLAVAKQRLKEAAETAKVELSQSSVARVTLPDILGCALDEEISLTDYNRLISPLVDRTISKVRDVLRAARLTAADIDRVILVGGSTRNMLVKERVAEAVKEPYVSERVDEVVAQGAAIVASSLSLPDEDMTPTEFHNVTPFSLGVRVSRGKDKDIFGVIVPRNSSLPVAASHEFTTYRTNQKSVEIAVFQGESTKCKENTFIGGFQLTGLPPAPAGKPVISVQFAMDMSDLLNVTASCSHLRSERALDVNLISREDELAPVAPEVDIIFLVDTSGSMSAELDGVKRSCTEFAERVMQEGIGCRLGLMDFDLGVIAGVGLARGAGLVRDHGGYNWQIFGPMDPVQFSGAIAGLRIGRLGGVGCYIGKANTVTVIRAFVKAFPDPNRTRIGILISDEVGNDAHAINEIGRILAEAGVCLYSVGVAGSCHQKLAEQTGGRFWDIFASRGHVDFSDLLNAIAVEITHLAVRE